MLNSLISGTLQGIGRGIGLLIVAGIAYASYRISYNSFRNTESFDPGSRPRHLATAFHHALFGAATVAVLITFLSGYAHVSGCTPDYANGEVDCTRSVSRSTQEVVATLVTALVLLVGPVLGAKLEYHPPGPDAPWPPAA